MILERSYSGAIFLGRPSFQNIWKKKIWLSVQCMKDLACSMKINSMVDKLRQTKPKNGL